VANDVAGNVIDCSKPFGVPVWSIQAVRSLSESEPLAVSVVPFARQAHSRQVRIAASVPSVFL
jgi:hypothetical protein